MRCNESALPEYTEMAQSNQEYRAIEKTCFIPLKIYITVLSAFFFKHLQSAILRV